MLDMSVPSPKLWQTRVSVSGTPLFEREYDLHHTAHRPAIMGSAVVRPAWAAARTSYKSRIASHKRSIQPQTQHHRDEPNGP